MESVDASTCFLTDSLPPEMRQRIYEYVLPSGKVLGPRRLARDVEQTTQDGVDNGMLRGQPMAILQTCRLIYREAIPLLYDCNTISSPGSAFCMRSAEGLPFEPQLVRSLLIPDSNGSLQCKQLSGPVPGNRSAVSFLPKVKPQQLVDGVICSSCGVPLLDFINDLKLLPRLREIIVEYGGEFKLVQSLRGCLRQDGLEGSLRCTGIGQFRLDSPPHSIVLRHPLLMTAWALHTGLDIISDGWLAAALEKRIEKFIRKLGEGRIPAALAGLWPKETPRDLRVLNVIAGSPPEYLEQFEEGLDLTWFRVQPHHHSFLQAFNDCLEMLLHRRDLTWRRDWLLPFRRRAGSI